MLFDDFSEADAIAIRGNRILSVGTDGEVRAAAGEDALVVDLAGKTVMPGLVCTHSHVGEPWGADRAHPIQPEARVLDGMNVRASSVERARAGGLTTLNCMPGSGHLLSGQTIYLKLREGRTIDDLTIKDPDGAVMGGIKMANGTNSIRLKPFPGTRGKSAALVREQFIKAQEYNAKWDAWNAKAETEDDPGSPPARDPRSETRRRRAPLRATRAGGKGSDRSHR